MGAIAVRMPKLGLTMEEGRVVAWPRPLGDRIEKGTLLVVIESEKAEAEIDATAEGFLRHVYVAAGETVPCGALLAALTATSDEAFDAAEFARREGGAPAAPAPSTAARAPTPRAPVAAAPGGPAAPAARALARELGVDLSSVRGTGPGGRITRQDVEAFAAVRAAEALAPGAERVEVAQGVALECLRGGRGDPVLLLPGFGVDVSSFAPQATRLSETHAVIGLAPRGVGGSSAPVLPRYDVSRTAADAAAALEALGVTGPAHVIGASLGAAVALELAFACPERVRSLALLTPFLAPTPRLLAVADAWARAASEAKPDTLARLLAPWLFSDATLGDEGRRERMLRGLAPMLARTPATALARTVEGLRAWRGAEREVLARLRVPVVVVVGASDILTPDGEAVAEAIPGAALARVAGAGHAVAVEAPEAVNAALVAHLARG